MATSADPIIGILTKGDSPLLSRAITINVAGVETVALQVHFDEITYRVFDEQTGEITETPETLVIPDVIDDTPPSIGLLDDMNFSFQLSGSTYLNRRNRLRKIRVLFELTGGETFSREHWLWT